MINVVLCADERYAPYCAVVILTAMAHAADAANLHFFVLTPGLTPKTARSLRDMVKSHGSKLNIVTTEGALSMPGDAVLGRFGIGAVIRLYMHRHLPADCRKVIYLDCDLLVLEDIAALWHCPLSGEAIGAVTDLCSPNAHAKLASAPAYCNTGVLVVDMTLWREQNIGERALSRLQAEALTYPDQDALNHVLQGRWASLDLAWNFQPTAYRAIEKNYPYLRARRSEMEQAARHPKIVHFIGGVKPWHAECTHPLQSLFIHFSAYTPWPIDKAALMATLPLQKRLRQACKCIKIWNRKRKLAYRLPLNFQ